MALKVQHSVVINKPVDEVYAYTSDPNKQTEWQEGLVRVESTGPVTVGSQMTEVRKVMGREMETVMEVVVLDPPNKFSAKSVTGPVEMTFTTTNKAVDGGTQIDVLIEGEPGGFFGVAAPLLQRQVAKDVKKDYAKLKEILEG
jgi:uncharacterized membrane protein